MSQSGHVRAYKYAFQFATNNFSLDIKAHREDTSHLQLRPIFIQVLNMFKKLN